MMKNNFFALGLVAAFFLIMHPTWAQPIPEKKPEQEVPEYDVDYEEIESYGLYSRPREGSLGRDLWSRTPRSAILGNIKWMPDQSDHIILQKIFYGALLSRTNAGLVVNDIEAVPGEDLLTLRIGKLLAMGAYKQAAELYSLADEDPYHPALAFNGITALLASGDKSLACLEAKNAQQRFGYDSQIRDAAAYCDLFADGEVAKEAKALLRNSSSSVLKKIAADKNYSVTYAPGSLAPLTSFELGVLHAGGHLKAGSLSDADIKTMAPRYIGLFLDQDALSPRRYFLMMLQAARWGLVSYDDLQELYEDVTVSSKDSSGWQELAKLYQQLDKAARGEESWDILSQALSVGSEYHPSALMPFIKPLEDAKPEGASLQDMARALKILNYAGAEISERWGERLIEISNSAQKKDQALFERIFIALYIAAPQYKREDFAKKFPETIDKVEKIYNKNENNLALSLALMDYFRSGNERNDTDILFYDKTFLLTLSRDYVMPTYQVWDRLHKAAMSGSIGETILLSSNILRNLRYGGATLASERHLYPGTLRGIMGSFDKVGLTQFSRQLAISIVLEL